MPSLSLKIINYENLCSTMTITVEDLSVKDIRRASTINDLHKTIVGRMFQRP